MTHYNEGQPEEAIRFAIRDGDVTIDGTFVGHGQGIDVENGWPKSNEIVRRTSQGDRTMTDEIVERLNTAAYKVEFPEYSGLFFEACAEIERLRALITAWADAVDNDERDGWVSSEVIQAETELRKVVGR